jgi:hypothetical protein
MLVLRREEGQWIEIAHRSGDLIRIRVYNIRSRFPGQVDMAFDDDARHFDIRRGERKDRAPARLAPVSTGALAEDGS